LVTMMLWMLLGLPPFLALVLLVPFFLLFRKLLRNLGGRPAYPSGFNARYAHDNIAIDVDAGKLWLRDKSGRTRVVARGDILRWNRSFRPRNGFEIENSLEIHVRDLDQPKAEVLFNRHSDLLKSGARRNA